MIQMISIKEFVENKKIDGNLYVLLLTTPASKKIGAKEAEEILGLARGTYFTRKKYLIEHWDEIDVLGHEINEIPQWVLDNLATPQLVKIWLLWRAGIEDMKIISNMLDKGNYKTVGVPESLTLVKANMRSRRNEKLMSYTKGEVADKLAESWSK